MTTALPSDFRDEVKMLIGGHHPFEKDCQLEPLAQAVFYHYDVPKAALLKFLGAVGCNLLSVRLADPDTTDGKSFFDKGAKDISSCNVHKLRLAVRRLMKAEPLAALHKRAASPPASSRPSKAHKV